MFWMKPIILEAISRGRVVIDIPNLDTDRMIQALHGQAEETLRDASYIVFNDELNDTEKVNQLAKLLL